MRYRGSVDGGYKSLARALLDQAIADNDKVFLSSRLAKLCEAILAEPYAPSSIAPEISHLCASMHTGSMAWEFRW